MRRRPAFVLGAGLALTTAAALAPVGLSGRAVPAWVWPVWAVTFGVALALGRASGIAPDRQVRRLLWVAPAVAVFAVPAAWLGPDGARGPLAIRLLARGIASVSLGAALASYLGPSGLARGVRDLGVPTRLADVFESTLVSLATILVRLHAMLRAREARRPAHGAWSAVARSPVETVRGVGRLVASLLLRSLERAEALERARRARGGPA